MERIALITQLKPGTRPRAAELIAEGPPFELARAGIVDQTVYLTDREALFVVEAERPAILQRLTGGLPFPPGERLEQWAAIVEGSPRIARQHATWQIEPVELDRERHLG
jgi:hypothetical protein